MHSLSFNLKTKYYGHVDKLIYSSLLPLGLLRNLGPASLDLNSSSPKTWIWWDKTGWWQWNKSVQTKHWHFKFVVQAKTCSKNWILSKKKKIILSLVIFKIERVGFRKIEFFYIHSLFLLLLPKRSLSPIVTFSTQKTG